MTVLGIDTSGTLGGVALARDGRLVGEIRCDARLAVSERILPQIMQLLADQGLEKEAVTRIGIALGPGSFTGLRVGLATAKGLGQGLDIPLVGISSLQARIFALGVPNKPVLAVSSLRRGKVFVTAGIWEGAGLRTLLPEASRSLDEARQWVGEALEACGELGSSRLLCTGDAALALRDQFCEDVPEAGQLLFLPGMPGALPGAVALMAAVAAEEETLTGSALLDLMPRYLRGSDARLPRNRQSRSSELRPPGREGT
ncbi:MAG: tRNA (adenosine(37)-N6)-threonylcarbamoyltransferase complex dimerization subunit type 1 TsaB [Candidatus Eisenbacteria sp.]|nr:tRNA (adenosine(37)-N6)-threonylcarbamoyltransferase complex dimerization subunit type 1 TsaB [Candidatus Eisenbacteria bacterium]